MYRSHGLAAACCWTAAVKPTAPRLAAANRDAFAKKLRRDCEVPWSSLSCSFARDTAARSSIELMTIPPISMTSSVNEEQYKRYFDAATSLRTVEIWTSPSVRKDGRRIVPSVLP
jgi:hypothetical protein